MTSIGYAYADGKHVSYLHPGSLLFKRTKLGLMPVGVIDTVPNNADASELNQRAPLSTAHWQRHIHFCFASDKVVKADPKLIAAVATTDLSTRRGLPSFKRALDSRRFRLDDP